MRWIEVSISTSSAGIEYVEAVLLMSGISGWQVFNEDEIREHLADNPKEWDCLDDKVFDEYPESITAMFFVSDEKIGTDLVEEIKADLGEMKLSLPDVDMGTLEVKLSLVDDDNWLESWKEFFVPFAVGKRLVIKPPWEEFESDDRIVVDINPGHVFGTGHHETTRMCIEALERYLKPGDKMLDLGCGSGILSIIGILFGAADSVAVDHSPGASGVVSLNAEANGIEMSKINVYIGDVLKPKRLEKAVYENQYDLIVANIITGVIVSLSPMLSRAGCLKPGGFYISSGIVDDRLDEAVSAITGAGFSILETIEDGGWACIIATHK